LLGRVVDALGTRSTARPIKATRTLDRALAPGVFIVSREPAVQTGYKAIDSMVRSAAPARAHHRDRQTQDRDRHRYDHQPEVLRIKCIYVAIGQKQSTIANVVRKLEEPCMGTPSLSPPLLPCRPPCSTFRVLGVTMASTS